MVRCLPRVGGRGGRTWAKAWLAPLRAFRTEETPGHLDCASAPVVAVTASIRECCRTIGSVLGRRSVPPVQPPARGTVTVMGRERPRLRLAKSVPGPTSGVAHAPMSVSAISPSASRCHPGISMHNRPSITSLDPALRYADTDRFQWTCAHAKTCAVTAAGIR
jgi:hypothetical protein